MGSLKTRRWPPVLLHVLLLQLQSAKVQAADPMSLKLRRLNEQFHQFKTSAQARLDMLALNQDKTSSQGQKSRVQSLNNHSHHMSRDLEQLKQSTALDIDTLRDWSRKLEKKNKRMDARLALMERKLREKCRHTQKLMPDPGLDFSNFTLELERQKESLATLQTQHDELLLGLEGLKETMKKQALRVSQLEGQLSEILQETGNGKIRGPPSNITAQKHYEPHGRMMDRGGMPRRIPDRHQIKTNSHQFHGKNQPEFKPKLQSKSRLRHQVQHPELKDYHNSQSQIQTQVQTRPSPNNQEHLQVHKTKPQVQSPSHLQRQIRLPDHKHPSSMQPLSHHSSRPEFSKDVQDRIRLEGTHGPIGHTQGEDQEQDSHTDLESSLIRDFLQIPVRHKIPDQPLPRKDAVICNVDSMLLFPSASAENYVSFSVSLPDLPELSVCLWLRVEASPIGTLLSYATDNNDNQLVLYGRRPSTLSTPFPLSSYSYSFSPPSSFSSHSLDFVIGDPVYRRLPVASLLDAHWHHLCVVWSSIQGRFWHYTDRYLISSGSNFRKAWEIPGGGSVVLGQEQDSVGGGFDPAEGFAGQIAGFRMWNRVLSASEVEGVASGRGVPRGVVLGMEDIKEVHGDVEQVACECLEHCV
ncbi:pentraxin-4 [Salarias fasciatus]|uniref:pentraxin-4 n=1 Tax=Salarias fasciatus TaxID=181472 RepID=UPI001176EE5A|nr:pentraxin-4 [Salarias fasciatus]